MNLHIKMCFSSSMICLLVITCQGSIINAYRSELGYQEDDNGSQFHDTSHISAQNMTKNNQTSPDFIHLPSSSHLTPSNDDASQYVPTPKNSRTIISKNSNENVKRVRRGVNDDFELPLPERNAHSEVDLLKQGPVLSNGHSHTHRHGNNSDGNHDDHSEYHGAHQLSKNDDSLEDDHSLSSFPDKGIDLGTLNNKPCGNEHGGQKLKENDEDDHDHDHQPSANYHQHYPSNTPSISGRVWLHASVAVIVISLCGLISVAVIPIMQKWFYHTLLQFLVGLAIGSLSGDGLLHLMPHAILDGEDAHNHAKGEGHHHENRMAVENMEVKAIWRGLAALCGIFVFFIAERLLGAFATHRRQKREAKLSRLSSNMMPVSREEGANNGSVGEKLAQPKKNSYDHIKEKDEKETLQMLQTEASPSKKGSTHSVHEIGFHGRSSFSIEPEVTVAYRPDSDSSIIVSEHHGHGHGHSHEIPQSVSAVAWMVIMGDGLHNFCDGLAIGTAFASGDADGISTTVAVFCHELPHELGDFAMLLKTGMKVKQALFYNAISSILCFIGMIIGVSLGTVHSAINWVFAGTAGMFLYIALVDMLPELSSPINTPGLAAVSTLLVQVLGISIGICIMLLIALYEHELHSIVS